MQFEWYKDFVPPITLPVGANAVGLFKFGHRPSTVKFEYKDFVALLEKDPEDIKLYLSRIARSLSRPMVCDDSCYEPGAFRGLTKKEDTHALHDQRKT